MWESAGPPLPIVLWASLCLKKVTSWDHFVVSAWGMPMDNRVAVTETEWRRPVLGCHTAKHATSQPSDSKEAVAHQSTKGRGDAVYKCLHRPATEILAYIVLILCL
ncbi:hypothetical protein BDV25DRAFT_143928 [Aspergillus avenaceus]|uniref:Secreted protein n=1 Tax=Aspergillus avenaceus TaxID=36643 RepID=A0A5N6TJC1_ASPAV|nr:hypothetical protein BDV25DRAFT_143928 [Aspergillus avenaceus]